MAKKKCSCCGIEWKLSAFHNDRTRRDGKFPWCKMCRRVGRKEPSESDDVIVNAIQRLSFRNERVFPLAVQMNLGVQIAVRQLRQEMARLAHQGKIVRLGPRSGYLSVEVYRMRMTG